jgi:MYND finger
MLDGTVNVKSKTEYYNTDKILSKWGFTDNHCHHCGILNSDLNGLLMQCGKCKKAYYCSMKVRVSRAGHEA